MSTQTIPIHVNGEPRDVSQGLTLEKLLDELGIRPDRVAIELNRAIVKRPHWAETEVAEGAQIEIVQFVGGG